MYVIAKIKRKIQEEIKKSRDGSVIMFLKECVCNTKKVSLFINKVILNNHIFDSKINTIQKDSFNEV